MFHDRQAFAPQELNISDTNIIKRGKYQRQIISIELNQYLNGRQICIFVGQNDIYDILIFVVVVVSNLPFYPCFSY